MDLLIFFLKIPLSAGGWLESRNLWTWQHSYFGTPVSCVCSLKFVRTENFHRTVSVVPTYFLWSLAAWFNILRDAKYAYAHLVMYRQLEFSGLRSGSFLAFKRIEEYADFSSVDSWKRISVWEFGFSYIIPILLLKIPFLLVALSFELRLGCSRCMSSYCFSFKLILSPPFQYAAVLHFVVFIRIRAAFLWLHWAQKYALLIETQ